MSTENNTEEAAPKRAKMVVPGFEGTAWKPEVVEVLPVVKVKVKAKKAKEEEPTIERFGMVLWTDGGARPENPGPAGWGLHGYLYNAVPPKKGSGLGEYAITSTGYVLKDVFQKAALKPASQELWDGYVLGVVKTFEVTPVSYCDAYGSFPEKRTNNVAELVAAVRALEYAFNYDIKVLRLMLDSQYVRQGITEWFEGWKRNGWTTKTGEPVKNRFEWELLDAALKALEARGVRVEWAWTKGHAVDEAGRVKDLGNDIADRFATAACLKSADRIQGIAHDSQLEDCTTSQAEGYWKYDTEKHPFISHRRMYFNTTMDYCQPGEYYIGEHGKEDELLGKRINNGAYAVVKLGQPDLALETVRKRMIQLARGANTVALARVDQVFTPSTHREITYLGLHALEKHKKDLLDLRSLDRKPVTHELTPARLAHRVATAVEDMCLWRDMYLENHPKISVTDLTSILYESQVKPGKKSKDGQAEDRVEFLLKPEYNTGFAKLPVDASYAAADGVKSLPVILILGMDLPDRNALKRLEGYQPKISLITWMESPAVFRYATVIETAQDIGIWAGYYSNSRVLGS